jgi:uncharacterized protein YodC (DUF2158 family)
MADEIKAGDIVMLKSGGPSMTVVFIEGEEAYCQWFDAKKEHQDRRFYLVTLKLV